MSQDSSLSQSSTLTATPAADEILYFAYGPNMSSAAMLRRCPGAVPVALAYLPGWKWLVNERGFANVVPLLPSAFDTFRASRGSSSSSGSSSGGNKEVLRGEDGVYGVLYLLPEREESMLDVYEGVSEGFDKAVLEVEMVTATPPGSDAGKSGYSSGVDEDDKAVRVQVVKALVYLDQERVSDGRPEGGYVGWMNRGIGEAVGDWGMPAWYVDGVLRRYIPAEDDDDEGVGMES
ncbi:hypothetical protein jhhlp_000298 [Lomentospora prolificans]|uniref:gamma-glutamylcyclotransferase n=1 Tax=Lomentospora prolificans TaxID=41688 RepID=A0A2N3NKI4_9PEZI|nr:hypothetical protein jhhlp_000298 [Lomentospora prolificans]